MQNMAVKKGDKVKIEYTGTLNDSTVFDSSDKHDAPLEFEVGAGQVIPGFENAVIGMNKGEEKEFKIPPSEAYGEHKDEMMKNVPRDQLPEGDKIQAGSVLIAQAPNGAQIPLRVVKADEKEVTIDFNHPLAGQTLNFKIKVLDIYS